MEENKNIMENTEELINEETEETVETEVKTNKVKDFVVKNKKLIIAGVAAIGAIVLGKTLIKNDSVVQDLVESTEVLDTVTDVVEDIVTPE